jgi:triphosphatase
MSLEQELKLVVNQAEKLNLTLVQWLQPLVDGESIESKLISTYYDTPEKHLQTLGVGLRMRQYDGQWMQTVKTSGVVTNGLHQRDEWEHDLAKADWDSDKLKATPLRELMEQPKVWDTLAPLFTTDFVRDTLQIKYHDGTHIELAYDRGSVYSGELNQSIHEVELELKAGSVEALTELAGRLCAELPLTPSNASKAKMGYELALKANELINLG